MITQDELKELLSYNPNTGVFTWNVGFGNQVFVGDVAGTVRKKTGYRKIVINGRKYYAHRLAFLYMNGEMPKYVDHINRDSDDNCWSNLRETTNQDNCRNQGLSKNNTSGANGVYFDKRRGKWIARIKVDYKYKFLGSFEDINDAVSARQAANIEYGFADNHGAASKGVILS